MSASLPTDERNDYAVQLSPSVKESNGALWVHKDYALARQPWEDEGHVGPPEANEAFGDVPSFVAYVKRFGNKNSYLSWNGGGLYAVLDYHEGPSDPGRRKWVARYGFTLSPEWVAWRELAGGHPIPQKRAVEMLEDREDDIVDPPNADLMTLLRSMRATVNKSSTAIHNPDGTTQVSWEGSTGVGARGGTTDLPAAFTIAIPVLKGHVVEQDYTDGGGKLVRAGTPYKYRLTVRVRADVDSDAKLSLRFHLPNQERTLEAVYAERVAAAQALFGTDFQLLRAGDRF